MNGQTTSGDFATCLHGWLECFWNNVEIITSSFRVFNGLCWCCGGICLSCIGTRSSPSSLTCCEDSVNHVNPIEERVNNKHDWIKHDLISSKTGAEVKHKNPVQSKGNGNETNR